MKERFLISETSMKSGVILVVNWSLKIFFYLINDRIDLGGKAQENNVTLGVPVPEECDSGNKERIL
jgi:phage-related holin